MNNICELANNNPKDCDKSLCRLYVLYRSFSYCNSQILVPGAQLPVTCDIQIALQWRNNGRNSVSSHQPHDCLLNRLFRRKSKKTSKLRIAGLCAANSPGTSEFPTQMASNADNVSIWWLITDNMIITERYQQMYPKSLMSKSNNINLNIKLLNNLNHEIMSIYKIMWCYNVIYQFQYNADTISVYVLYVSYLAHHYLFLSGWARCWPFGSIFSGHR